MNPYQTQLYVDLITLTQTNEAFYFQDFDLAGTTYRIFNYRLASYTDWLQPGAFDARGVMFELATDSRGMVGAARLAALPMKKFFNLNENPLTMDLDLTKVVEIQEKADGSLMSTYMHNNELRLKSKGSLFSEQAIAAMEWLAHTENTELRILLLNATRQGVTVNLEWCSPVHRIVLGYEKPVLKVFNFRSVETGEYWYLEKLVPLWEPYMVAVVDDFDPPSFIASIPVMEGVEGYVVRLEDGTRIKIKSDWYLSLHHAKDSVNNPRRLFEAILDEGIDDLRSLFYTDVVVMKLIDEMQIKVDHLYNAMVKIVEAYYEANKHLDRKSYAIKGQEELDRLYFGLAMNKYVGKEMNYKAFLKSKWKDLGLKDVAISDE